MATPTLEINAIRDYLISVGCKIEYPILVNAFKQHLYNPDPNVQGKIRTQFKDYVNRLATVCLENNMKFILLRPEFRPSNINNNAKLASLSESRQQQQQPPVQLANNLPTNKQKDQRIILQEQQQKLPQQQIPQQQQQRQKPSLTVFNDNISTPPPPPPPHLGSSHLRHQQSVTPISTKAPSSPSVPKQNSVQYTTLQQQQQQQQQPMQHQRQQQHPIQQQQHNSYQQSPPQRIPQPPPPSAQPPMVPQHHRSPSMPVSTMSSYSQSPRNQMPPPRPPPRRRQSTASLYKSTPRPIEKTNRETPETARKSLVSRVREQAFRLNSSASTNDLTASLMPQRNRSMRELNRLSRDSAFSGSLSSALQRNGSHLTTRSRSSHREDESDSSSLQPIDPLRRKWIIETCSCNYNGLLTLLGEDAKLATYKDIVNGYTALHWAAKFGNLEIIKLIAGTHQVSANIKSSAGQTPLHVAYMFNRLDAANLLLKDYNANPGIRDHSGRRPLQYWRKNDENASSVAIIAATNK